MSKTKSKRHEQDAIAEKISHITHQSKEKTASSMLPTLKRVLPRDTDLAVQLTKKLDLNVKELQYLVGEQSKEIHLLATQPTPQEKKPSTAQATNNQNIQAQTKLGEN